MTFTLTINGESAAELLTALQQLNPTPLEKPQSKPAKAPAKQQRPAPTAPEKPAAAPAAAPHRETGACRRGTAADAVE